MAVTNMKFIKIIGVDFLNLTEETVASLNDLADEVKIYDDDPETGDEVIKRIDDADCVLCSWRTRIDDSILNRCKNVKYIGLCCTSDDNIDISNIYERDITVTNISHYCDEATAEYMFSQLLSLVKGLGKCQWKEQSSELNGKTIGIVGLGGVGKSVAKIALGFGMNVQYNSRTRKPEFEEKGCKYLELDELLGSSNIVSLNTPENTIVLSRDKFALIPEGAILMNNTVGKAYEAEDFADWISNRKNFAIIDSVIDGELIGDFPDLPNVVYMDVVGGWSIESKKRFSDIAIMNIDSYLKGNSINVVQKSNY